MPSLNVILALAVALAAAGAILIVEERRVGTLKADLDAATSRLNTCAEVQGIRDAINSLSIPDVVGALTRRPGAR